MVFIITMSKVRGFMNSSYHSKLQVIIALTAYIIKTCLILQII